MARENLVILHGQVIIKPTIYVGKEGEYLQGTFLLKTMRRPRGLDRNIDQTHDIDCPIILSKDEEMIKKIADLTVGDMVEIKGALSTREVTKKSTCPHCNAENKKQGNTIFVTPIYLEKREEELSETDGMMLLRTRDEVSNLCVMIGTLCRDVEFYRDGKKRAYAEYQLAVNRKFRVPGDHEAIKTDYPWVKSFGKQAEKDKEALSIGSVVFLNAAIQVRDFPKPAVCSSCGQKYEYMEKATELVPYSTEYLRNYKEIGNEDDTDEFEMNPITMEDENGETESA